jgi:transcription initiation factor IIE alpha subunit
MMEDKRFFNCPECGKIIDAEENSRKIPECCQKPMEEVEPLHICTARNPEQARLNDPDDPCDDGLAGNP